MNIYRKLFFLIYNLILNTPSKDEFPYLLSIVTLSGLLGFNIVLFFDAFISNSKLGENGKALFIFLYIFIGILNFFYFRKDFKKNNKARIVLHSLEFMILILLIIFPITLMILRRHGYIS